MQSSASTPAPLASGQGSAGHDEAVSGGGATGSSCGSSHHTVEKGESGGSHGRRDPHNTSNNRNGDGADPDAADKGTADDDSYTTYYDYSSGYSDEEGAEAERDDEGYSDGASGSSGRRRSSSSASPPSQEDLLRFLSYTLDDAALKDHRLMAMEAFRQVLVLGTNQGAVAIVDPSTGRLREVYTNHHEPICDVDCTVNEMYVAACDKAGYVSIQSRRDAKDVWMAELSGPIVSIAMHPQYHKMDSCPAVCGGGTKVILLTKGVLWSNARRVTTLQEGRGRIHKVRWCPVTTVDVVAWLSDAELSLYDMKNEALLRRLALSGTVPQKALYPATLRWERNPPQRDAALLATATLLCGWGDVVQEVRVHAGSHARRLSQGTAGSAVGGYTSGWTTRGSSAAPVAPAATNTAPDGQRLMMAASPLRLSAASDTASAAAALMRRPTYTVEPRTAQPLRPSVTPFPYRVCGIAPFGPQRYVVLASIVERGAEGVMKDLEVRVVDRDTLADVYRGRMPVRFIHPLQLHLTHLEPTPSALGQSPSSPRQPPALPPSPLAPSPLAQYFILSMDTIVKAMPSDIDDHVEFLLRCRQYEQAYRYAASRVRQLRRHVLEHVGHQWLMHLFRTRETEPGALLKIVELLPELVPRDKSSAWEQWMYRLDTCGESWRLVALLPGSTGASAEYRVHEAAADAADAGAGQQDDDTSPPSPPPPVATLQTPIQREYYDLVLLRCLRHDPSLFFAALHKFHTLFSVPAVLQATEAAYREHCTSAAWWQDRDSDSEDELNSAAAATQPATTAGDAGTAAPASDEMTRRSSPAMGRTSRWSLAAAYGFLLRCAGRHEEALQVLLHLPASPRSDRELFGLIREQQLFHKARALLPELLQRSEDATLALLLEHAAADAPRGGLEGSGSGSGQAAAAASPVASPISGAASPLPQSTAQLDASQYGSAQDPLNPESVVLRLEHSDRLHLLKYLNSLQERHPAVFVQTVKQHAQLVATLYMDHDRPALLPFLKQMSMYVERIRELHALCHKHHYLEEEIFLLFRMGREDEALRILVEKMHDLPRALRFVVSVPDREEQAALFARLVDYTVSYNAGLPTRVLDGSSTTAEETAPAHRGTPRGVWVRYVTHKTKPEDTYVSIAQHYHVAVVDVCRANGVPVPASRGTDEVPGGGGVESQASPAGALLDRSTPAARQCAGVGALGERRRGRAAELDAETAARLPRPSSPSVVVPLNLLGDLLEAFAEPQFMEHPALDVRLVLRRLPDSEPILRAGPSIAAIAHTTAEEIGFLSTVSEVGEKDLMGYYGQLLKRRTAAIVMGRADGAAEAQPGAAAAVTAATAEAPSVLHRCAACRQLVTQQVVVFPCQHMYHPACMLQYVRKAPAAADRASGGAYVAFGAAMASPMTASSSAAAGAQTVEELLRQVPVYCRACRQHSGEH